VEAAIRHAHPGIEQHLGCGAVGFSLMHEESAILLAVLEACREEGITALGLHDAVACAASQAVRVQGIMEAVYRQATGRVARVDIKPASAEPDTLSEPEDHDDAEA